MASAPPSRLVFLIDAACLQNVREQDPLGGAWGVYHALCHARALLPTGGLWGYKLFSSQARARVWPCVPLLC